MEKNVLNKKTCGWKNLSSKEKDEIFDFSNEYISFLNECKTERETSKYIIEKLKSNGFIDIKNVKKLSSGDKVYMLNRDKSMYAAVIGEEKLENGFNLVGSHIDSPRLDLKPNPLYEDAKLALFKTHYYGGIKKYQWTTIPLSLKGVVVKPNGEKVEINIGEKEDDPVVGVSDLLIHLASEQMTKKADKVVEGEDLNVLVGSMPAAKKTDDSDSENNQDVKEEKERVKANILSLLKEKYGIEEEDFLSAELCVVPAGPARDYGFDKSMIMGYGHDDKVCAYPSLIAQLESVKPEKTSVCILVDKEEIGSVGATGMHSRFFENMVAEVMDRCGQYSELKLRRTLTNSCMLSSDVNSAFDPNYANVNEKKNTAYFGKGVVFMKYTGSRGKSGSNDASAEYIGKLRKIMDDNNVSFQTAELGRVDLGGGGTIAYILANYGMNVIDSGVGVQNMHAPYEVISKVDLYEAYKSYKAFLKDA